MDCSTGRQTTFPSAISRERRSMTSCHSAWTACAKRTSILGLYVAVAWEANGWARCAVPLRPLPPPPVATFFFSRPEPKAQSPKPAFPACPAEAWEAKCVCQFMATKDEPN